MKISDPKARFTAPEHTAKKAAVCILTVYVLAFLAGCDTAPAPVSTGNPPCSGFSVASIHIAGLTQFLSGGENGSQVIRAFIELRDAYDSKIKAPVTLRFDLYGYVPHSSDPRGKHLQTWPDFDLQDPPANQLYWRDYLRAYEFSLEVKPPVFPEGSYLLDVTCMTEEPKRISASYVLQVK